MAIDPVQGLIDYVNEVKPFHTKILEVAVAYSHNDDVDITITEDLQLDIALFWPAIVGSPDEGPIRVCSAGYGVEYDRATPYIIVDANISPQTISLEGNYEEAFAVGSRIEIREPYTSAAFASPVTETTPRVAIARILSIAYDTSLDRTVLGIVILSEDWLGSPAVFVPGTPSTTDVVAIGSLTFSNFGAAGYSSSVFIDYGSPITYAGSPRSILTGSPLPSTVIAGDANARMDTASVDSPGENVIALPTTGSTSISGQQTLNLVSAPALGVDASAMTISRSTLAVFEPNISGNDIDYQVYRSDVSPESTSSTSFVDVPGAEIDMTQLVNGDTYFLFASYGAYLDNTTNIFEVQFVDETDTLMTGSLNVDETAAGVGSTRTKRYEYLTTFTATTAGTGLIKMQMRVQSSGTVSVKDVQLLAMNMTQLGSAVTSNVTSGSQTINNGGWAGLTGSSISVGNGSDDYLFLAAAQFDGYDGGAGTEVALELDYGSPTIRHIITKDLEDSQAPLTYGFVWTEEALPATNAQVVSQSSGGVSWSMLYSSIVAINLSSFASAASTSSQTFRTPHTSDEPQSVHSLSFGTATSGSPLVMPPAGSPPIVGDEWWFPPYAGNESGGDVFAIYDVVSTNTLNLSFKRPIVYYGSPITLGASPYTPVWPSSGSPVPGSPKIVTGSPATYPNFGSPIQFASGNTIVIKSTTPEVFLYGQEIEIRNASNADINRDYNILRARDLGGSPNLVELTVLDRILLDTTNDGELLFTPDGFSGGDICGDVPPEILQTHWLEDLDFSWRFGDGSPKQVMGDAFQHFIISADSALNTIVVQGDVRYILTDFANGSPASLGSPNISASIQHARSAYGSPFWIGSPYVDLNANNGPVTIQNIVYDATVNESTLTLNSVAVSDPTGWIVSTLTPPVPPTPPTPPPPPSSLTTWSISQNTDMPSDGMWGLNVAITDDGSRIYLGPQNAPESVDTAGTQFDGAVYTYRVLAGSPVVYGAADLFSHTDAQNQPDYFGGDNLNASNKNQIAVFENGTTIAIGAWGYPFGGNSAGAVKIFDLSGSPLTYSQVDTFQGGSPQLNQRFGSVVAATGDGGIGSRLAVGAYNESDPVGAVYIFENQLGTWTQIQKLQGGYGANDRRFGLTLTMSRDGSVLAVGQNGTASGGPTNFFYNTYSWNGSTYDLIERFLPNAADDIAASQATSYGGLQADISDDGNTLVTSIYGNYVWVSFLSGGTWTTQELSSLMPNLSRGNSVASGVAINGDGNIIFVASNNEVGGVAEGVIHILKRTGGSPEWTLQQSINNPNTDETTFSSWGSDIASNITGDAIVVGNPWGAGFGGGGNFTVIRGTT